MSYQKDLEMVIMECCNSNLLIYNEYEQKIINNFLICDLSECKITKVQLDKLRESYGRKLIMTRPKFRKCFRKQIYINLKVNKIVKEKGFNVEDVEFPNDLNRNIIENLCDTCLQIFINKQKNLI